MEQKGLLIDYEYCSGCRSCEVACRNEKLFANDQFGIKVCEIGPFAVDEETNDYVWNYYPMLTKLCDLCEERVELGGVPSCMLHCLASVIEYGTLDELNEKLKAKGGKGYIVMP